MGANSPVKVHQTITHLTTFSTCSTYKTVPSQPPVILTISV